MWKLLLIPLVLYAAVVAALWLFHGRMVFPAGMVAGLRRRRSRPAPSASSSTRRTASASTASASPRARAHRPDDRPLILGFGGNAWNGDAVAITLAGLFPDHDVAAFHYRGYRPSSGTPGARAILADALLVHDELARRTGGRRIVAVGFSLGTESPPASPPSARSPARSSSRPTIPSPPSPPSIIPGSRCASSSATKCPPPPRTSPAPAPPSPSSPPSATPSSSRSAHRGAAPPRRQPRVFHRIVRAPTTTTSTSARSFRAAMREALARR
jgi:hypothetical protein